MFQTFGAGQNDDSHTSAEQQLGQRMAIRERVPNIRRVD